MPPRPTIFLKRSNKTFRAASEIGRFAKSLIDKLATPDGTVINQDHEAFPFFADILERNSKLKQKVETTPILRFRFADEVPPTQKYRSKTQYVMFSDSPLWLNFSLTKCLYSYETNKKTYDARKSRKLVEDQIDEKREELGEWVTCHKCGATTGKYEVDHVRPFSDILRTWNIEKGERSEEEFADFHRENAVLQPICLACHWGKSRSENRIRDKRKILEEKEAKEIEKAPAKEELRKLMFLDD